MASEPSFRLTVRRGPNANQVYEMTKNVMTAGRDVTNDIVVSDPEVSRHHTRLSRSGNTYAVEDLGSTNGTYVNGQRVSGGAHALNNGDLVGVGETVTFVFEATGVAAQATLVGSGAQAPPPPAPAAPVPAPAPAPPPPAPRYAAPMADESGARPQLNRALVIGVVAVLGVGCLILALLVLFGQFWCAVPIANQMPVMCVP